MTVPVSSLHQNIKPLPEPPHKNGKIRKSFNLNRLSEGQPRTNHPSSLKQTITFTLSLNLAPP